MRRKYKVGLGILLVVVACILFALLLRGTNVAVLNPEGTIADEQRNLILIATLLSLIVIVPVYTLTFFIARKYRADNKKATYSPEWDHNNKLEFIWWGIPCAIIVVLSIITWQTTHQLDPYKPLASEAEPVRVQVVALDWKWLFIYPEEKIASVNYVQFPEDTPVNFEITADAPMNSFWIPQLGGQVYAMAGMITKLHLMADKQGIYTGSSANISGEGFAGMKFTARSTTDADYETWIQSVRQSSNALDYETYEKLAEPSKDNPATYYVLSDDKLYSRVLMKYMAPHTDKDTDTTQHEHENQTEVMHEHHH